MAKPVSLYDCILLGIHLGVLTNPEATTSDTYVGNVEPFRRFLQYLGLQTTDEAASVLSKTKLFCDQRTNMLTHQSVSTLKCAMEIITKVLQQEAVPRHMIALKSGDLSDKLRNLGQVLTNLTPAQQHLLDETILCVECEAYRAGAVMAWNLTYDRIRQWVFVNRLPELNAGLVAENPNKTPIASYPDFFKKDAPGEGLFLKACQRQESGPIIGGDLYDNLVQYLRYRNKYAHSSEIEATGEKIRGYIDHLLDIITIAPFG